MSERPSPHEVTALLLHWREGDEAALERLLPIVYDELRRVARARLRYERAGHVLQATALVHEVYLRLVDSNQMTLQSRAHFLALAGRLMRQVLIDHARRGLARKRGGGVTLTGLEGIPSSDGGSVIDAIALDEALTKLASFDERLCRVVEMRFFAGLSIDETAEALALSRATVERDWATAKAWLYQRLSSLQ